MVERRESAHTTSRAAAVDLLKQRVHELRGGTYVGAKAEQVMFGDLERVLLSDYAENGRLSARRVKNALAHLREAFQNHRAVAITRVKVRAYIAERLKAGAARATVQVELSALNRAFVLAARLDMVPVAPRFERLRVANTRSTSFTRAELGRVLEVLEHGRGKSPTSLALKAVPELVAPIRFAATTGWRLSSDVFPLRWSQVDLDAGTVTRWSRDSVKATETVVFPFGVVPELRALLHRQRELTSDLERASGRIVPWVFHRADGSPIRWCYTSWRKACSAAGIPGRVPHDLRRFAARTLRTLGLSDRDIAEAVGWRTTAMVGRYLGRDPQGVAERLAAALSERGTRTEHGRFSVSGDSGSR
jgi:integrase